MHIYVYKIQAFLEMDDPQCECEVFEGIVHAESYPDAMARIVNYYGNGIVTVDELTETEFEDIIEFRDVKEYFYENV